MLQQGNKAMSANFSSKAERKRKLPWLILSVVFFVFGASAYLYLSNGNEGNIALILTLLLPASLLVALPMVFVKSATKE
jgi:hypothetical protein